MCTGIMDNQKISHIYLRQHTVDCKLIVILTQRTGYIVHMVA